MVCYEEALEIRKNLLDDGDLDNVNHPVHYKMKCLDSIKYYIGVFVLESFCFL